MISPYAITLSLFVVAGLLVTGWGWRNIANAKQSLKWPNVTGTIEESSPESIVFRYEIKERIYKYTLNIPLDVSLEQQSINKTSESYPQGKDVAIYYQPDNPENATTEPGLKNDDWLILILGLTATTLGTTFLVFV